MKPQLQATAFAATIAMVTLASCSSPSERHDVRVDRRGDVVDRTGERIDSRQENRYDRRDDRRDRVETRY